MNEGHAYIALPVCIPTDRDYDRPSFIVLRWAGREKDYSLFESRHLCRVSLNNPLSRAGTPHFFYSLPALPLVGSRRADVSAQHPVDFAAVFFAPKKMARDYY